MCDISSSPTCFVTLRCSGRRIVRDAVLVWLVDVPQSVGRVLHSEVGNDDDDMIRLEECNLQGASLDSRGSRGRAEICSKHTMPTQQQVHDQIMDYERTIEILIGFGIFLALRIQTPRSCSAIASWVYRELSK